MSSTILVSSQRNNVGKSLLSIKLAVEYSLQDCKTILIDASSCGKSIDEYIAMEENVIYDLVDVVEGTCEIDYAKINVDNKFDIIPTPRLKEKMNNLNQEKFTSFIESLSNDYDKIIIEINGINNACFVDLSCITSVIIVNNNEFSSLNQINNDFTLCCDNNINDRHVLINMFNNKKAKKGTALNKKDFSKLFQPHVLNIINYDDKYSSLNNEYILKKYDDELCKSINSFTKKIV